MTLEEWLPKDGWGCASSDEIAKAAWDAAAKATEMKIGTDIALEGKFALGIKHGTTYTLVPTPGIKPLCREDEENERLISSMKL